MTATRSITREVPGRGALMPTLRGTTPDGVAISTRDYYMRRNLALVFVRDDDEGRAWVSEAAALAAQAEAEAGQIVVVAPSGVPTEGLPLIVDDDGELHRRIGLEASDLPALFVTDRYGTIFAATHGEHAIEDLGPCDIPNWLEFVSCRCT